MAYYLYKVDVSEGMAMLKHLQLIGEFEQFRDAKNKAKILRTEQTPQSTESYKVVFAENQLQAEELLLEKRDKPILMEHEK